MSSTSMPAQRHAPDCHPGGLEVVGLLGGVVITETVFNYPGIGQAAAEAASNWTWSPCWDLPFSMV